MTPAANPLTLYTISYSVRFLVDFPLELFRGYWTQRVNEKLGDPLPKVQPGGLRSLYCRGSALFGNLLGISRSVECDFLFVLSIYPRTKERTNYLFYDILFAENMDVV